VIIGMAACHRRDGTHHHHRRADLHRLPAAVPGRANRRLGLFDWLFSPFTVMPIQIFNWTSRPDPAFHQNAAAASFVLC
jgi:hypothetical protein